MTILNEFKNTLRRLEQKDKKKFNKKTKQTCLADLHRVVAVLEEDSDINKWIKLIEANPYTYGVCNKEDRKKCNLLDMSKFTPLASVPKCDYVLPEQYNLFKRRKGYKPGDPAEDPTLDRIIHKDNYVMFYLLFVILLAIYILVVIYKSIVK